MELGVLLLFSFKDTRLFQNMHEDGIGPFYFKHRNKKKKKMIKEARIQNSENFSPLVTLLAFYLIFHVICLLFSIVLYFKCLHNLWGLFLFSEYFSFTSFLVFRFCAVFLLMSALILMSNSIFYFLSIYYMIMLWYKVLTPD